MSSPKCTTLVVTYRLQSQNRLSTANEIAEGRGHTALISCCALAPGSGYISAFTSQRLSAALTFGLRWRNTRSWLNQQRRWSRTARNVKIAKERAKREEEIARAARARNWTCTTWRTQTHYRISAHSQAGQQSVHNGYFTQTEI